MDPKLGCYAHVFPCSASQWWSQKGVGGVSKFWSWGEEEEADETRAHQLRLRNEDGMVSSSLLVITR